MRAMRVGVVLGLLAGGAVAPGERASVGEPVSLGMCCNTWGLCVPIPCPKPKPQPVPPTMEREP